VSIGTVRIQKRKQPYDSIDVHAVIDVFILKLLFADNI